MDTSDLAKRMKGYEKSWTKIFDKKDASFVETGWLAFSYFYKEFQKTI